MWLFDQSSGHTAWSDDALVANLMNKKPSGKQPHMKDSMFDGKPQETVMDDEDNTPTGAELVLQEPRVDTSGMKLEVMRKRLSEYEDFKSEKSILENFLESRGHTCIFIPKFQCEFNPTEHVWAKGKRHTCKHCNYSIVRLRKHVNPGLDTVTIDDIRKYFRKSREYRVLSEMDMNLALLLRILYKCTNHIAALAI